MCANAAESIVALVQILERNKLLEQISSDVIHMLSQAALVSTGARYVIKNIAHYCSSVALSISFMVRFYNNFRSDTAAILIELPCPAYNSSLPDVGMANRAKLNFSQCCLWMRDLSRSWPPASSHRIFFEGRKCLPDVALCATVAQLLRRSRSHPRRTRAIVEYGWHPPAATCPF